MQDAHIVAVACLISAVISAMLGWGWRKGQMSDKDRAWLLRSVQIFLVGILVCLIEIAWGGT